YGYRRSDRRAQEFVSGRRAGHLPADDAGGARAHGGAVAGARLGGARAGVLGLMAVLALGLGWVVAGRVLRPLQRITATAKRLSERTLHQRIALEGPDDELKELADTL